MNSKSNSLIYLGVPKKTTNYLERRKANGKTETLYTRLQRNAKQCQWLLRQLGNSDFNVTIVVVKHSTALHTRSSKGNEASQHENIDLQKIKDGLNLLKVF